MDIAELISWTALAMAFAGAFGIFATHRALRRLGALTMAAGLIAFTLTTLHTVLSHPLAANPALPLIWTLMVPTTVITIGWLTRYFYRDFDLHDVEDS
ncbi:hypothetical protein [Citricoccus sp. I39-566]|uniref:hypothetical protein n=1 Tax=Citricoccus sp. I39-566 TaxID=3073268 RepID=UPI00286C0895|nr:hypothetical protein [Citricoccus sp. I39-566]WMY80091.1 hypothetical protein RE421_16590 [Citricoccus sp. I39-566]